MLNGKRRGLLLDQTGSVAAALKDFGLRDWEFRLVTSIDEAREALADEPPLLGLVAFDPECPWRHREIEALTATDDIEWIAIVDVDLLRHRIHGPAVLRAFHDFHTLPLDRHRLSVTLGHAWGKAQLGRSADAPRRVHEDALGRFGMIGRHPRMLQLYRQLDQIVTVDAPVLIGGEAGTGKALVAAAIHSNSERAASPFVTMNCGAIPPRLIQSELFGHDDDARGAVSRPGRLEAAHGGVLFLEGIEDLPLETQGSLLRFLQERTIVRSGSTERTRVNVRVIAASRLELGSAVGHGRFRADLYERLNVVHLRVPPLRERVGDVPLLANTIFEQWRHQKGSMAKGFSSEALHALSEYAWPGNVRELGDRVRAAAVMTRSKLITAADLGIPAPALDTITRTLADGAAGEKDVAVSQHRYGGNVPIAAYPFAYNAPTLHRVIDRLKLVF